jgi:tRNA modification GTPase
VQRARDAMDDVDLVFWLQAPDQLIESPPGPDELHREGVEHPAAVVRLGTKLDLGTVPGVALAVSAETGAGIDALLQRLHEASGAEAVSAGEVLVSHERDREALSAAALRLADVEGHVDQAELAAEDLRACAAALERLLGTMDAEVVLDRLFLSFCIGK